MRAALKNLTWRHYSLVLYILALLVHVAVDHYMPAFPSFVFPSFSTAPKLDSTVNLSFVEILGVTADGHRVKLSKNAFFKGLYEKHINFFLNASMKKEGGRIRGERAAEQKRNFSAYCAARCKKIYPSKEFDSLIIQRVQRIYHVGLNKFEPGVTIDETMSVSLF